MQNNGLNPKLRLYHNFMVQFLSYTVQKIGEKGKDPRD